MKLRALLGTILVLGLCSSAFAGSVTIYVGYADGLRGSPTFPSIWDGDPNTIFIGAGPYDAGAFMITNNSGAPVVFGGALYNSNGALWNGINIWGSGTIIPDGWNLILTQTFAYNFDTSESYGGACCSNQNPGVFPTIAITLDGVTNVYNDTGLVSSTGNFDLAVTGQNEALGWRPIGTTGIGNPGNQLAPEPASMLLMATGLAGILRKKLRK